MVSVSRFDAAAREEWDRFIAESKNGTFLFHRAYMDYHSSRFRDHSLLFREGGKLVATMPASQHGPELVSHGGLTYGGILSGRQMKSAAMLEIFNVLRDHARREAITRLVYKRVPFIYHDLPSEEDLYALFRTGATLSRRDVSSAIAAAERPAYSRMRQRRIDKSGRAGLTIGRSDDFAGFMRVQEALLKTRYGVKPVHTAEEITLLAGRFPENVKLFTATKDGRLTAGVLIYESRNVAHAQYIAATEEGRELSALDAVFDVLLSVEYRHKPYFDFGISTEQEGQYLNVGLIENKESYGARAVVYDTYELLFT
ncbi:MAG: GNAT family N-acetyltransferase [Acidobacteriota bacterium]